VIVKICGITNPEDAWAATEAGASAVGFIFYPASRRYVPPQAAAAIVQALPQSVWKVGVFVNEPPEHVTAVASQVGLDVAQLLNTRDRLGCPSVDTPACPRVLDPPLRIWRTIPVGPGFTLDQLEVWPEAEALLLDTAVPGHYGGTGRTFPWALARGATRKVILAGGLHAGNVGEAIRAARPWGVDASSSLETVPGRKDHTRVAAFIAAALSEPES